MVQSSVLVDPQSGKEEQQTVRNGRPSVTKAPRARFRGGSLLVLALLVCLPLSASAQEVRYFYDELGRLTAVVDPAGEATFYAYDAAGNLLTITRRSGVNPAGPILTPEQGLRGEILLLTVYGEGFAGATLSSPNPGLSFPSTRASTFLVSARLMISSTAPLGATVITVTSPTRAASASFIVLNPPPVVTGFSPTEGLSGATVLIAGSFFDDSNPANNTVRFNGVLASILAVTATTITVRVPEGATSGPISVTTPSGTAVSSTVFLANLPPVITRFEPQGGAPGSRVTLFGRFFDGVTPSANTITFSNGVVAPVLAATANALTTQVPAGATTGPISVTTRFGIGTSATNFVITDFVFPGVVATIQGGFQAPQALAVTPDGTQVYVANANAAFLSVIDTATNTVIRTFPLPNPARTLAFTPNGMRLLVTANNVRGFSGLDDLNMFDVATGTLIQRVTLNGRGSRIGITPDGQKAYVAVTERVGGELVQIFNLSSLSAVTSLTFFQAVFDLKVSANGARVYVAQFSFDSTQNLIQVIDTATDTVVASIPMPREIVGFSFRIVPRAIGVFPSGTKFYAAVTVESSPPEQALLVINAATLGIERILRNLPVVFGGNFAIAPDGVRVFVPSSGGVAVLEGRSDVLVGVIPFVSTANLAITPDGRRVYASQPADNSVAVIE